MLKNLLNKNIFLISTFFLCSVIPFIITVGNIYNGRIAFWYDPARDFLLALQNLVSPTLIGQPSGIPGIFYGPYWIWLISLITLVSKDPRFVSFILLTIPYFTIFPFFLYKISKRWGIFVFFSLWLIFILNFGGYAIQIWNINLSPLLLLMAIYFSINANPNKSSATSRLVFLISGLLTGFVANFHLSMGSAAFVGFFLYFFTIHIIENNKIRSLVFLRKTVLNLLIFIIGTSFSFLPFLMFELRHNFNQTKTFIDTVSNSVLHNSSVVGVTGMSDSDIISSFFNRFSELVGSPGLHLTIGTLIIVSYVFLVIIYRKKPHVSIQDIRLFILLIFLSLSMLSIFLVNKNPTWDYYFVGVEIIFLLFLGLVFSKMQILKYVLIIPILFSLAANAEELRNSISKNSYMNTDLGTEIYIVEQISKDAGGSFYYYAYNPAIQTYEYDYLFRWKSKNLNEQSELVYLIIPKIKKETREDYINYKTPKEKYKQIKKWSIADGTTIYKMIETNEENL